MIDRDKLNSIRGQAAAVGTFSLLDRAQDLLPENQLVSSAALFLMLCEKHRVDPQDVMTVTKNLMFQDGERHEEFKAIADYLRYEL